MTPRRWLPIMFSGPMVLAILADLKTQTRRLAKPRHLRDDRLYVREGLKVMSIGHADALFYAADGAGVLPTGGFYPRDFKMPARRHVPSMHAPRWTTRAALEVVDVWSEKLLDISDEDVIAEGFESRDEMRALWKKFHGNGSWDLGPTVWVTGFMRLPDTVLPAARGKK